LSEGEQKIAELKTKGQADITRQEAERAKGIYRSVEDYREKNPAPELTPTKDNIQSLSTLFGLIGVIGMAMGGAGKMSATASLNSMAGMMKGWQQGRSDLWKKEVQEFDKNMLSWKAKLDDAIKKAEAAYKILPYNRAEAESQLNEVLTSMGSGLLKEQNRVQGFEPTFKNLESLAKDAEFAIKESGVERRHRETLASQERLRQAQLGTNQLLKIDPAIRNKLGEYPDYDLNKLIGIPTKSQTQVVESFESLDSIEDIGRFVRSNPDAVGLVAELANRTNINTLDSLQTWDTQVNSNPNLPESAKLLNKMLTSQAYRDVSATGQRPTVYLDRVFKDLYSQNSSPTALLSILKQREKEANSVLSRYDLSIEKNANSARFELHKTEPRDYMKSAKFVTPSGQEVSALDVEETAKKRKKNFATVVRELGLKPAPQPVPVGGQ
jgi:tetratricopeptide (TPR) repeat protein